MFAMKLALQVGRLDVDRMLAAMDVRQLVEWMAYDNLLPFGQDHTDFLIAQLNADVATFVSRKPIAPTDKLPRYKKPDQSPDEILAQLRTALNR